MEVLFVDPIKRANQIARYVLIMVGVVNAVVLAWKIMHN